MTKRETMSGDARLVELIIRCILGVEGVQCKIENLDAYEEDNDGKDLAPRELLAEVSENNGEGDPDAEKQEVGGEDISDAKNHESLDK